MRGSTFIANYVMDPALQHCSSYAIVRAEAARKVGVPRTLDLRAHGLEDGSGIDHDIIFTVATTADVDSKAEAPIRRRIMGGFTEQYPLTFAYTQYQYAKRLMRELEPIGFVSVKTRRAYFALWHLILSRGLVVAYRPVLGIELEGGVSRIRKHLPAPIAFYIPWELIRTRAIPTVEMIVNYLRAAHAVIQGWRSWREPVRTHDAEQRR